MAVYLIDLIANCLTFCPKNVYKFQTFERPWTGRLKMRRRP